jgi:hypothetical protein
MLNAHHEHPSGSRKRKVERMISMGVSGRPSFIEFGMVVLGLVLRVVSGWAVV